MRSVRYLCNPSLPPMLPDKNTSQPGMSRPAEFVAGTTAARKPWPRWLTSLDQVIFLLLLIFVVLLPHSIKGCEHLWRAAFVLWLIKMVLERRRPWPQPLSAPLLVFVGLTAISTLLSPDPYLSWDRMKIVAMVLVGVLFAQQLERLKQVRILVYALILSGLAAAAFTAWQYTYGVGVRISYITPQSALYRAGLHHDDIITAIGRNRVHTPAQLERQVQQSPLDQRIELHYLHGSPFQKGLAFTTRRGFEQSGLGTAALQFARGKPTRAEGTLHHYVVFAEMLMQIGCMTLAVLLGAGPGTWKLRVFLAVAFLAMTAALVATETRAALAGLAVGGLAALWALASKRTRLAATSLLLVVCLIGGSWIYHKRGLNWEDTNDPGAHFRMLMWEDGVRLVRQHPWFGVGMETVRLHWQEWNIRGFALYHVLSHFHSTFLQIAVERGLPALAAWLWFVVAYLIFLVRLLRRAQRQSRFAAAVVAGALAGFVAFQTTALVHYNLGEESLVMILFFYFGLALAIDRMLCTPGALEMP